MGTIYFNYADVSSISLRHKTLVKKFLCDLFKNEKKHVKVIHYIFCSDKYLLNINQVYLKHDYHTDIITFDLSSDNGIIGEIYISTERVKENSKTFNSQYKEELVRVMIHGLLHLCGYGDKRKSEITLMKEKEEYYLQSFKKAFSLCFT